MGEYHKIIGELLQEFDDLQISETTKRVNVINTRGPIDGSASIIQAQYI